MAGRASGLLIEIGTEELPAADQEPLARALAGELGRRLRECGLAGPAKDEDSCRIYWTPRRLAVVVAAVAAREPDREIERKGPTFQAAFDDQGRPTAAAQGFARAAGVSVEALERDPSGRLLHRYVEPGRPIADVLRTILPEIFAALPVPRRMHWGDGECAFLRPVRWLVVLHGPRAVPVEAFGILSGHASRGHRVRHPGPVPISAPAAYAEALRSAGVLAEPAERLAEIKRGVAAAAQSAGADPAGTEALYREIAGMTEWPVALAARFDPRFLELPDPVIVTTLVHHQRFVPLRDGRGGLTNAFVAVVNLESRDPAAVRHGLERVVRPRLEDATFYYRRDRERPLADYARDLAGLAFAPKLGSMAEKTRRISRLAVEAARVTGADAGLAERAGRLAKCDLVTGMVFEFPELQGVIGGHYAAEDGETPEVACAIAEQYLPGGADDPLPETPTGIALGIADRLDTLVGGFAAGMAPNGARDPFGLRRAAFGVLRLAAEKAPQLDLDPLLELSAELFPPDLKADSSLPTLREFLRERLRSMILDKGWGADVAQAVLAVAPMAPGDVLRRAEALAKFRTRPEAEALAAANKRITNILHHVDLNEYPNLLRLQEQELQDQLLTDAKAGSGHFINAWILDQWGKGSFEDGCLPKDAELELKDAFMEVGSKLRLLGTHNYVDVLETFVGLRKPVDRFFDEVLVMDPNPVIRERLLLLLMAIRLAFMRVADISELQGMGNNKVVG